MGKICPFHADEWVHGSRRPTGRPPTVVTGPAGIRGTVRGSGSNSRSPRVCLNWVGWRTS